MLTHVDEYAQTDHDSVPGLLLEVAFAMCSAITLLGLDPGCASTNGSDLPQPVALNSLTIAMMQRSNLT